MMALADAETFVLSANFHGGVEVVNYPWDTWERRHPDDDWFIDLSRDYADLAQADSPAGYMTTLEQRHHQRLGLVSESREAARTS